MTIEKKGLLYGAIWGLITAIFGTGFSLPLFFAIPIINYAVFAPARITALFGKLIFGKPPYGSLITVVWIFYIAGSILTGALLGYVIAKIYLKLKSEK